MVHDMDDSAAIVCATRRADDLTSELESLLAVELAPKVCPSSARPQRSCRLKDLRSGE